MSNQLSELENYKKLYSFIEKEGVAQITSEWGNHPELDDCVQIEDPDFLNVIKIWLQRKKDQLSIPPGYEIL